MQSTLTKITSIVLALMLLFSLGLHSIQTDHAHYGSSAVRTHTHTHNHTVGVSTDTHNSESDPTFAEISEKMHMAEKKIVLFIFGATLLFFAFQLVQWIAYQRIQYIKYGTYCAYRKRFLNILFSYIRRSYSLGILNPKLY
jgi:4-hydroxybenzoate polyprenyltransferase